jgi:hypothetical protein
MRVEIIAEPPDLKKRVQSDRRESREEASQSNVLANFRAAVSSKDSLFRLLDSVAGFLGQSDGVPGGYASQFVIAFRRLDLSGNRNLYFVLLRTLKELLKETSSSDALFATMCVMGPITEEVLARGPYPVLQLEAIGNTPEQAEFRWMSGLAHVQKALLCASRLLALHLAKTGV